MRCYYDFRGTVLDLTGGEQWLGRFGARDTSVARIELKHTTALLILLSSDQVITFCFFPPNSPAQTSYSPLQTQSQKWQFAPNHLGNTKFYSILLLRPSRRMQKNLKPPFFLSAFLTFGVVE